MPSASNAKLQYEAGQTAYAMAALTDSGDRTTFEAAAAPWSRRDLFAPIVRPNGVLTGGVVTPAASGTANLVDVSAGSAWLGGALITWTAETDLTVTSRANDGADPTHQVISVIVTGTDTVTVDAGTGHTAIIETRDGTGGPPLLAAGAIELAQVRVTSKVAAAITAAEIFAVPGVHRELALYPVWDVDYLSGEITFASALPASHTDSAAKGVYASYATPSFADVAIASDFRPPENSYSVSSTQVYGRTLGSSSQSLSAGEFTAYLNDGITDPLVGLAGEMLWFKFFPNQYASSYIMSQGQLGIVRTFPAGDNISAACTIAAEAAATNVQA
jgi:hypothetical protein